MKLVVSLATAALLGALCPLPASAQAPAGPAPRVLLETSMGDITVELAPAKAPITADNFLKYVKSGFYSGTIFHRVIEGFMIQGGGYTKESNQKTPLYPPIKLESRNGLHNARGSIAMARTRVPDSATCQFFINVVDNPALDYSPTTNPTGYAVFGHVIAGMDVVDRISKVRVVDSPMDFQADGTAAVSFPSTPVVIQGARLLQPDGGSGK